MGYTRNSIDRSEVFKIIDNTETFPFFLTENSKYIEIKNNDKVNSMFVHLRTLTDGILTIPLNPSEPYESKVSEYDQIHITGESTSFKIAIGRWRNGMADSNG